MKKTIVIALCILAIFAVTRMSRKPAATQAASDSPQGAVYQMLAAAKAGDVPRYLSAFAGPMAATLQPSISAQYLRETNAALKGVAISNPQDVTGDRATLQVQFIYQDRTETQCVQLLRESQTWKIANIEDAHPTKTLIPYGTPVRLQRSSR